MSHSGTPYRTANLPPPVEPAARVGVAALSGPVDPDELRQGLQELRELGFEPVLSSNLGERWRLFAGRDEDRLDGFHELAADPTLKAIFFARGGHGLIRLLPKLDWELLGRHPRAYVGYSDLTPFLGEVVRRLELAAFHGPMITSDMARGLEQVEKDSLLGALTGDFTQPIPVRADATQPSVEGRLSGGCLSLLSAVVGTPFQENLDDSIFFWEDFSEPLYRIDRMLNHLKLSGSLSRTRAMVVGNVEAENGTEMLSEFAQEMGQVIALDCPSGHCIPNLTLPFGLPARLDSKRGELLVGLTD